MGLAEWGLCSPLPKWIQNDGRLPLLLLPPWGFSRRLATRYIPWQTLVGVAGTLYSPPNVVGVLRWSYVGGSSRLGLEIGSETEGLGLKMDVVPSVPQPAVFSWDSKCSSQCCTPLGIQSHACDSVHSVINIVGLNRLCIPPLGFSRRLAAHRSPWQILVGVAGEAWVPPSVSGLTRVGNSQFRYSPLGFNRKFDLKTS